LLAGDELAREERVELLVFDVVPAVESGFGHGDRCLSLGWPWREMNFSLCVARSLV
jgi:hypothetical protein